MVGFLKYKFTGLFKDRRSKSTMLRERTYFYENNYLLEKIFARKLTLLHILKMPLIYEIIDDSWVLNQLLHATCCTITHCVTFGKPQRTPMRVGKF